jgi:pimeloyl-ACP methyl ester carboxylesterase
MRTGMVSPAAARGSSTLGICSTNDRYLDGERMKMSDRFVKGPWRYEQIEGVSHWIPLDAPDQLNQLLIEWLG